MENAEENEKKVTITLFDKDKNFLDQGTVYHMVKWYGIDERNLRKGLKKYDLDCSQNVNNEYSVDYIEFTLNDECSLEKGKTLIQNGVRLSKIGDFYYTPQDIEFRATSEKEIPFMQGSTHNYLIYTKIPTRKEQLAHSCFVDKNDTVEYISEYEEYLEKYSTMSIDAVREESNFNYYKNPNIDAIKAKACFAAAFERIAGKPLPWFPVREKDVMNISAECFRF